MTCRRCLFCCWLQVYYWDYISRHIFRDYIQYPVPPSSPSPGNCMHSHRTWSDISHHYVESSGTFAPPEFSCWECTTVYYFICSGRINKMLYTRTWSFMARDSYSWQSCIKCYEESTLVDPETESTTKWNRYDVLWSFPGLDAIYTPSHSNSQYFFGIENWVSPCHSYLKV